MLTLRYHTHFHAWKDILIVNTGGQSKTKSSFSGYLSRDAPYTVLLHDSFVFTNRGSFACKEITSFKLTELKRRLYLLIALSSPWWSVYFIYNLWGQGLFDLGRRAGFPPFASTTQLHFLPITFCSVIQKTPLLFPVGFSQWYYQEMGRWEESKARVCPPHSLPSLSSYKLFIEIISFEPSQLNSVSCLTQ